MAESSESTAEVTTGLLVPPAAAVGFVSAVGLGAVAPPHAWWAAVALVVGCSVTATTGSPRAAPVIGLLWALCADGFVAHRYGRLLPFAISDLGWLAAFLGAAVLGAWCRLPPTLVRHSVAATAARHVTDTSLERALLPTREAALAACNGPAERLPEGGRYSTPVDAALVGFPRIDDDDREQCPQRPDRAL